MRRLAFDIEADGLLDSITKIHCIVTEDVGTGDVRAFHDHPDLAPRDGGILDGIQFLNTADELNCHNLISYDAPAIKKVTGIVLTPSLIDTLIMSRLLYPDRQHVKGCKTGPHSLEAWGIRLGIAKPSHEEWEHFTPAMLHRCKEDVRIQAAVYNHLYSEEWENYDWSRAFRIEQKVAEICVQAEIHGWLFDKEKAQSHVDTLTEQMEELEGLILPKVPLVPKCKEGSLQSTNMTQAIDNLALAVGFVPQTARHLLEDTEQKKSWVRKPFLKSGKPNKNMAEWFEDGDVSQLSGPFSRIVWNPIKLSSDQQVKKYLLRIGWKPIEWNINKVTGEVTSPKLTEDSLDNLRNPVGKRIAQWIKCAHRRSQLQGWLDRVREDGTIAVSMTPMGTPTSRMTHKGIVNVPSIENEAFFAREMREVFIARPGYKVVGTDVASCQLRKLCHYMQDEMYTEAVLHGNSADGTDIHSVNMRLVGLDNRTQAKRFIYGFLFGAGDAKIGKIMGKGKQAGKSMRDSFFKQLPALKALIDGITDAWETRGYLIGLDGRKIFVRKRHELLCYLLQCAEAVLVKLALIIADDWIKQEGLDARLLIVYHDELQYEAREDHAERVGFLCKTAIQTAGRMLNVTVPMDGDPAIGNSWGDSH